MGRTLAYSRSLLPHPAPWIHFGFLSVVMVTPGTRSHDKLSTLDDSGRGEGLHGMKCFLKRQNRSGASRERAGRTKEHFTKF